MKRDLNSNQGPVLDISGLLERSKRMLRDLEQANMDRSQLSARPLTITLMAVGLSLMLAGILYRSHLLGASAGIRISYSFMAIGSGSVISLLAASLLASRQRLTTGVKTVITVVCTAVYFTALYLNGVMPAIFLPILVIITHLLWPIRVSLALSLLTAAASAPFMLQDAAASPAVSVRVLICTVIIILMMQILARQIIVSYRKSLQVSEQLSAMVGSLGEQLGHSQEKLDTALRTDADSGLMNAAGFSDALNSRLANAPKGIRYAVLCVRLKGMEISKSVLDEAERKAFLTILSQRFWRIAGSDGMVARSGRSDFLILLRLEEIDDRYDDMRLTQILKNLRQPLQLHKHSIPCSPFIGASIWPTNGNDSAELRRQAETAAHTAAVSEAKHVLTYDSSMHASIRERLKIISGIQAAVEMDQFELEYQPVFDLGFERFHKVEALIRWNHPELGRVPPNQFIPLLDSEQLIEVTAWVMNTVNAQMKKWHAEHGMRLDVAVNIPADYLHHRIANQKLFFGRLDTFDRNTGNLIFEITESSLFEAGEDALVFLAELRRRGFHVALDDFGTGFSNLRQLEVLPLDILKIDKSLIDEIDASERKMALCGYIIRLGHELGLKIVAEGIETEKQRDALIWAGCNYGQGYLFSKPVPAGRIPELFSAGQEAVA